MIPTDISQTKPLQAMLQNISLSLKTNKLSRSCGRVTQVVGTIIRASAPGAKIGELCMLGDRYSANQLPAEVVGFLEDEALLTPLGELTGVSSGTEVRPTGRSHRVTVGPALIGRVLDGLGAPIDGQGPLVGVTTYPVYAPPPNPMHRQLITRPLALGCEP